MQIHAGEGVGSYGDPVNVQEVIVQPMLFSFASSVCAPVETTCRISSSRGHNSDELQREQGALPILMLSLKPRGEWCWVDGEDGFPAPPLFIALREERN
jgi:hypothetical protein